MLFRLLQDPEQGSREKGKSGDGEKRRRGEEEKGRREKQEKGSRGAGKGRKAEEKRDG